MLAVLLVMMLAMMLVVMLTDLHLPCTAYPSHLRIIGQGDYVDDDADSDDGDDAENDDCDGDDDGCNGQ